MTDHTKALAEELGRIKSNLMHQRRFGVNDSGSWCLAAVQAEADIEELLTAYRAAQQTEPAPALGPEQWRPMESAPRDGSLLRLLVEFTEHATEDQTEPAPTIGSNSLANTGIDEWLFAGWCWTHDRFTQGEGKPVGWLPMLGDTPARIAQLKTELANWKRWCEEAERRSTPSLTVGEREAALEAAKRAGLIDWISDDGAYFTFPGFEVMSDKLVAFWRAAKPAAQAEPVALPHPGSPEASAMIDSVLAEYQWPTNAKNAARAGYVAAKRMLCDASSNPPAQCIDEREAFATWANRAGYDTAHTYDTDRSRWVFLNPMTADLWAAWQARAALAQAQKEQA